MKTLETVYNEKNVPGAYRNRKSEHDNLRFVNKSTRNR